MTHGEAQKGPRMQEALMKAIGSWTLPLALACFAFNGVSEAHAAGSKKKTKTEAMTLKIANLTKETPKAEVKKLEAEVKKIKGVKRVAVSKKKSEITVRHTKEATADAIKEAVAKAGFEVIEPNREPDDRPEDEPAGDEDHE
jgi:copper chaperone CopZ